MTMQTTTLRPGLLVSLKTTVTGNVAYDKTVIEDDHVDSTGALKAKWETLRTIADPDEHERAIKARGKAVGFVRAVCARSAFGLLCPESAAADLDASIIKAREVIDGFNRTAQLTRIGIYVITGRIAPDDVEAVRAINSEVTDLLATMTDGIRKLDVKVIRDAANTARNLGSMLTPDSQARIQIAIDAARGAARQIVKAGEAAAEEIDQRAIRQITEARTAFLDFSDEPVMSVRQPEVQGRVIDLAPA